MNDATVRLEALIRAMELARMRGGTGTPAEIVSEAEIFYAFLKKKNAK